MDKRRAQPIPTGALTTSACPSRRRTYPDSVDEVHVGLDGQRGVLDLHQLGEDHRQLDHLAEVDVDVVEPVRQRRVQQDEILEMHTPTGHTPVTNYSDTFATLAASGDERNATVWRPSVCPIFPTLIKVRFSYSAAYAMNGPARFTISQVAAVWQEPLVLQRKLHEVGAFFLIGLRRAAHTQRDSPVGSTRRGQRTFPSQGTNILV